MLLRDNVYSQRGIGICMVWGECIILRARGELVIIHWMCDQIVN